MHFWLMTRHSSVSSDFTSFGFDLRIRFPGGIHVTCMSARIVRACLRFRFAWYLFIRAAQRCGDEHYQGLIPSRGFSVWASHVLSVASLRALCLPP